MTVAKRIELGANIAIIIVAVLIGTVLVRNYFMPGRSRARQSNATLPVGTQIKLDSDWKSNGQTLLIFLQKGCHFCQESAPFYQRVIRETDGRPNLHLIAILPQSVDESREYLNKLGIKIVDLRQASLDQFGIGGTPTLVLVDDKGEVTASWVGKLADNDQAEVLKRL